LILQIAAMSSHHFVKENQEPALILAEQFDLTEVSGLLEWSPCIVAFPAAFESVALHGLHIDFAINYDSTSTSLAERPVDFQLLTSGVDLKSMLDVSLSVLMARNCTHINIWTSQPEAALRLLEGTHSTLGLAVVDRTHAWARISSGKFSKWLPSGYMLSYRGPGPAAIQNGNLSGAVITAVKDGLVTVQSPSSFWIGEPRGNKSEE
jgi:hypothetical protein